MTTSWQSHIITDSDMSFSQKRLKVSESSYTDMLHLSFHKGFGLIWNLKSFLFQLKHLGLTTPHLRQLHLTSNKPRSGITVFTLSSMGGEALAWLGIKSVSLFLIFQNKMLGLFVP